MNRQNFLNEFLNALEPISEEERVQISEYYEELICDGLEQGLTEDECIAKFGSPEDAASKFREEYTSETPAAEEKALAPVTALSDSFSPSGEIHTLNLNAANARVNVIPSDDVELSILTTGDNENNTVTSEVTDGVWYFTLSRKRDRKNIFLSLFKGFDNLTSELTVKVPKSFFGSLLLHTSNAKISVQDIHNIKKASLTSSNASIHVENSDANSFTIRTSNAKIVLSGVLSSDVSAHTTNAKISLEKSSGDLLKARTTNARISACECDFKSKFELTTTNAGVSIDKIKSDDISVSSSNGTITGTVCGDLREYASEAGTSNGKCNLPNVSYPDQTKRIAVFTSNGKIDVHFVL